MEVPESTQRHTRQTEADRAGAIYFVRRKFYFLWHDVRNFGPGDGTTSYYKGRIGPVVGISLPVGYTLVVSPKESSQRKRYTEEQGCRMLDWVNMTTTYCDGAVKQREGGERESLLHGSFVFSEYIWAAVRPIRQNDLCAQRRLRSAWTSALSDQSSLSAWSNIRSSATHCVHCEYSDQTGRMPWSIWVFAGRTGHFVPRLIWSNSKDASLNKGLG